MRQLFITFLLFCLYVSQAGGVVYIQTTSSGSSWDVDDDFSSDSSSDYTQLHNGTLSIASGVATSASGSDKCTVRHDTAASDGDMSVEASITRDGSTVPLICFRMDAATYSGTCLDTSDGYWAINSITSSSFSQITESTTAIGTPSSPFTIRIDSESLSSHKVYVNDSLVHTFTDTVSDHGDHAGFGFYYDDTNEVDDFKVKAL